ncbi:MAG: hypothetical protein ACK52S_09340, partial [Pirellula sp.]
RLSGVAHKQGSTNLNTYAYAYDPLSRIATILPERNPLRTHARDSRFETLKNAGEMSFPSWRVQVPPKLDQLPRSLLSRAVVNWRGDFPNASLFDRPVNNARV